MIKIQILGFSLTSILLIAGLLWYLGWLPFGSSSDDGEDYYMANTALLANNMLAMEYEMVNDNQDVNVHKQLRETALATAVLLKKVKLQALLVTMEHFDARSAQFCHQHSKMSLTLPTSMMHEAG